MEALRLTFLPCPCPRKLVSMCLFSRLSKETEESSPFPWGAVGFLLPCEVNALYHLHPREPPSLDISVVNPGMIWAPGNIVNLWVFKKVT